MQVVVISLEYFLCFSLLFKIQSKLKGHDMQHSSHMSQNVQIELIVEIYSKIVVRPIGKVFRMKLT